METRPNVLLPAPGRAISEFAAEVGGILAATGHWFVKDERAVVLREVQVADPVEGSCRGTTTTVFHYPSASECRSLVERYLQTGHEQGRGNTVTFVVQSMGKDTTTGLLDSPQFKDRLPRIRRILDVPIPIDMGGRLEMLQPGYNQRLQTYCRNDVTSIVPLPLEESKAVLNELLEGFCFANDLSRSLTVARLLTPMCRGLMGWSVRTPLWVFEANRPRAGKDYLAGCCGLLYEGRANEDAPLDRDSTETKKRIMAALQSGRRFMHFANSSGDIHNDVFEQAVTAKTISGRLLGGNDAASDLTLPNELEFSVSGNTGFSFTEDFALRCRRISLAFFEQDANSRTFPKPDLHGWVRQNRGRVLGALAGLIWEWDRQGRPAGPTPFTSFPEWASVVGGILVACGLGDPCRPQNDGTFTRDTVTDDMTSLFRLAFSVHGDDWITSRDLRELVSPDIAFGVDRDNDLFVQWDLRDRKGQTAFGMALQRYKGRILGGVRMEVDESDTNRRRYRFQLLEPSQPGRSLPGDESCGPCRPCRPQTQAGREGVSPRAVGNRSPRSTRSTDLGGLISCSVSQTGVASELQSSTGQPPGGRVGPPDSLPRCPRSPLAVDQLSPGGRTNSPAAPDPALN